MGRIPQFRFWSVALLMASQIVWASNTVHYQFGTSRIEFTRIKEKHLTISSACIPLEKKNCLAFKSLNGIKDIKIEEFLVKNGAKPGAILCERNLGGMIMKGKHTGGGFNAFCRFPDGSMIDTGSLSWHFTK